MEAEKSSAEKKEYEPKARVSKAMKFAKIVRDQFPDFVKGVLLFGSAAKGAKKAGDVDVLVILDDTDPKIFPEQIDKVDENVRLIADRIGDLHPQVHTITDFWDWIRHGDPILFNFLRYGYPIYDAGFLKPTQRLLEAGRITPSQEAIRLYSKIAPKNIEKAENYIRASIIRYYDAMTASAQAVAMLAYKHQPEPREIPSVLERMVKEGKLDQKYVDYYVHAFQLWKKIDHKEIKNVPGDILEKQRREAGEFVDAMNKFLKGYTEE
ncbi:MAG: nucleotidyltransferase domain-containing protein [Candidatus Aenigmarchaeota archaeon]|nr:nucleotidyltransferase domain-containing protein [Candidatus Aenigmarchaeota archaeon]